MTTRHGVEVAADGDALTEAGAAAAVGAARAAIGGYGRFVIARSGGSTPRALFELLATERFASSVDWARVEVCWGDERAVGPDAETSNYRMAREALLDHVPIPASQVHRMAGEEPPLIAAAAYERALRALFATPAGPPRCVAGARVSGADKAAMLHRVLEGPFDPDTFPAQSVVPHHGRLRWLVDVAAAGLLQEP